MFQGLRTVIYGVADIEKAKNWYTEAMSFGRYLEEPFYVGFNVGGYELRLDSNAEPISKASAGVAAYWSVENIAAKFKRLLALGAEEHGTAREVGGDIYVATIPDPFENIIGLIHNPHFTISKNG